VQRVVHRANCLLLGQRLHRPLEWKRFLRGRRLYIGLLDELRAMRELLHRQHCVLPMKAGQDPASRSLSCKAVRFLSPFCLLLGVGCTAEPDGTAPSQPTVSGAGIFVRFKQPKVFIDKLEEPFGVPAEIGSTLSSETLLSDSPQVVTVERNGELRAHMNGRARIHSALDDASFVAEVGVTKTLWISPAEVELVSGKSVPVRLTGEGGLQLDPEAVVWATSDPSLVRVERGRITAGNHAGRGHLVATYSGVRAEALITVRSSAPASLAFRSAPSLLRQGEVVRLELSDRVDAKWTTSRPKVLASLAPGLFQGKSRGRCEVCASTPFAQRICTMVEVTK